MLNVHGICPFLNEPCMCKTCDKWPLQTNTYLINQKHCFNVEKPPTTTTASSLTSSLNSLLEINKPQLSHKGRHVMSRIHTFKLLRCLGLKSSESTNKQRWCHRWGCWSWPEASRCNKNESKCKNEFEGDGWWQCENGWLLPLLPEILAFIGLEQFVAVCCVCQIVLLR